MDPKGCFASGLLPPADPNTEYKNDELDFRLKEGSGALDKGELLPNFNAGFAGTAPDLGAYELGQPAPHYGPRTPTATAPQPARTVNSTEKR